MNFNVLTSGNNAPEIINVMIEIPAHSEPVKYEIDPESGAIFVDRFMATSMHYPCNYGLIPQTLCGDGDPVDVLVLSPFPLLSGCVIPCRPIGMLGMTDEKGEDNKILAVPADHLTTQYRSIQEPADLPEVFLKSIEHFFEHYKDLEKGKWVKVTGWQGSQQAKAEILATIKAFKA